MEKNEKNILTVTCFGHFMSHFNMLMFPALVLPLTHIYQIRMEDVIALSFWMYLLFGLTALPWGLLTDRFGAKSLLLIFYLGAGICGILAYLFIDSPAIFSICLAGIGLFSGIYHPAGLGLISKGIKRISIGMGYNGMAGNAGLATAPFLTGIMNYLWGPKHAYLMLGIMNLAGALLMLLLSIDELPIERPKTQDKSKDLLTGFLILCISMMLGGVAYRGATVILPSYFELKSGGFFAVLNQLSFIPLSKNVSATLVTSFVFVVGIMGQYLGGRFADRYDPGIGYLVFHFLALPFCILMAFTTDIPLILFTMFYMLFLLGMQPIENTLVARLTPQRLRHSGYGIKFILTFGVGSLSVHIVRFVKMNYSLSAVFIFMSMVSAVIVITISVLIYKTRKINLNR